MSSQSAILKKADSNFVQPPLRDAQDRTLQLKQQAVFASKKIDSILVSQTNSQRIIYNFGGLAGSGLCGCTGGSMFPFRKKILP